MNSLESADYADYALWNPNVGPLEVLVASAGDGHGGTPLQ